MTRGPPTTPPTTHNLTQQLHNSLREHCRRHCEHMQLLGKPPTKQLTTQQQCSNKANQQCQQSVTACRSCSCNALLPLVTHAHGMLASKHRHLTLRTHPPATCRSLHTQQDTFTRGLNTVRQQLSQLISTHAPEPAPAPLQPGHNVAQHSLPAATRSKADP